MYRSYCWFVVPAVALLGCEMRTTEAPGTPPASAEAPQPAPQADALAAAPAEAASAPQEIKKGEGRPLKKVKVKKRKPLVKKDTAVAESAAEPEYVEEELTAEVGVAGCDAAGPHEQWTAHYRKLLSEHAAWMAEHTQAAGGTCELHVELDKEHAQILARHAELEKKHEAIINEHRRLEAQHAVDATNADQDHKRMADEHDTFAGEHAQILKDMEKLRAEHAAMVRVHHKTSRAVAATVP